MVLAAYKIQTNEILYLKIEEPVNENSLRNHLLRLETINPLSKASLQTCEPTKPLPPSTSIYTNTDVRSNSVSLKND